MTLDTSPGLMSMVRVSSAMTRLPMSGGAPHSTGPCHWRDWTRVSRSGPRSSTSTAVAQMRPGALPWNISLT